MPPKTRHTQQTLGDAWSSRPKRCRLNPNSETSTGSGAQSHSTTEKDQAETSPASRKQRTNPPTTPSSSSTNSIHKSQTTTPTNASETKDEPNKKSSPTSTPIPNPNPPHLIITHLHTSLFASPPTTLLCHATNAHGTWGAGIAATFKTTYPSAFAIYKSHCASHSHDPSLLLGTALLIPPQTTSRSATERKTRHWIGCLFTSVGKGRQKGSKESILEATGDAVRDLLGQVAELEGEEGIGEVRMCKINSGLFGVPWEATREVLEGVEVVEGHVGEVVVCSL